MYEPSFAAPRAGAARSLRAAVSHELFLRTPVFLVSYSSLGIACCSGDGKCVICDSYVRPCTLVRICDECNYGSYQGRCVICGGIGISDAYYCKECTQLEKDVSASCRRTGKSRHTRTSARVAERSRADLAHSFPCTRIPFLLCLSRCGVVPRHAQRDGCPKIVNLGSSKTDLFYERKKCGSHFGHACPTTLRELFLVHETLC